MGQLGPELLHYILTDGFATTPARGGKRPMRASVINFRFGDSGFRDSRFAMLWEATRCAALRCVRCDAMRRDATSKSATRCVASRCVACDAVRRQATRCNASLPPKYTCTAGAGGRSSPRPPPSLPPKYTCRAGWGKEPRKDPTAN